jgi:colicin import membrane protein
METKIAHYFATYKDSNECFSTSDGLLFHKKTDAAPHASTLADKRVISYDRASFTPKKEGADTEAEKVLAAEIKAKKEAEAAAKKAEADAKKAKAAEEAAAKKAEADAKNAADKAAKEAAKKEADKK